MLKNLFKIVTIFSIFFSESIYAQIDIDTLQNKNIYFSIDTFSLTNKKLYKIVKNSYSMFGSIIKFNYPCYYRNTEYPPESPEFFQFRKTVKTIGKKEMKNLPKISQNNFLELICKNGVIGGFLAKNYNIFFIEKLKKKKYLLYRVYSSPPYRIE